MPIVAALLLIASHVFVSANAGPAQAGFFTNGPAAQTLFAYKRVRLPGASGQLRPIRRQRRQHAQQTRPAQTQTAPTVTLRSGPVKLKSIIKGAPQKLYEESTPPKPAERQRSFRRGAFVEVPGAGSSSSRVADTSSRAAETSSPAGTHVLLHFDRRLSEKDFEALNAKGVHVWSYLEGTAYTATVDQADTDKLLEATKDIIKITSFETVRTQHKLERGLATPPPSQRRSRRRSEEASPAPAQTTVTVELWPDANFEQTKAELSRIGQVGSSSEYTKRLDITVPSMDLLSQLTGNKSVKFIAPKAVPTSQNTHIRRNMDVDTVQTGAGGLKGSGVKVAVFDDGHTAKGHPSFAGRLIDDRDGDEGTVYNPTKHATHVAGTIAANGSYQLPLTASLGAEPLTEQSFPAFGDILASSMSINNQAPPLVLAEKSYPGVAPGAQIVPYDSTGAADKLVKILIRTPGNVDLANNSWADEERDGSDCRAFGSYNDNARLFDKIVNGYVNGFTVKRIPIVFAAGNFRSLHVDGKYGTNSTASAICGWSPAPPYANYRSVTPPGTAKNVITVGAIDADTNALMDFSGFGPALDNRVKPDVVAPGCHNPGVLSTVPPNSISAACGTSQSAPAVTGLIALMMEKLDALGVDKATIYPSTYKALLIHAAQDLGTPGPDFAYGYGRVRAPETISLIANKSFSQATIGREGETMAKTVEVPAGAKEIKVTLAWDDPPRSSFGVGGLSNNLDLSLKSPSPSQDPILPWILDTTNGNEGKPAKPGVDNVNVVEQVSVPNPQAGSWQINVKATALGDVRIAQTYSLVVTVE
jgi:Subtilase family